MNILEATQYLVYQSYAYQRQFLSADECKRLFSHLDERDVDMLENIYQETLPTVH